MANMKVMIDSLNNLFDANVSKAIQFAQQKNFVILELEYDLPFWQFDIDLSKKRDMIRYGYEKCKQLFIDRKLL